MKKNYIILKIFLAFFFTVISQRAFAQFYRKHYIAPTTWNYFTEGNELVIATQSTSTVTVNITKSDGTFLQTVTTVKGAPAVYRPTGTINTPRLAFNTILNNAGVIITAEKAISVELRNIVGERSGNGTATVSGNALLISFGNAGLGKSFRVGYYRDDNTISGVETPIYSVMATNDNTKINLNGVLITTLNAGQGYLFKAPIGSLVTTSDYVVMNVSAQSDAPEGCGDSTADQIAPLSSVGNRYMMVRGKGNKTAEQIIVIAIEANTVLTLKHYNADGTLANTETRTLTAGGSYTKFNTGGSQTAVTGSVTEINSDKNVVVYAGTGDTCEVDVVTGVPISPCSGSFDIGSTRFLTYTTSGNALNPVPYFGYLYLTNSTDIVTLNDVNLENSAGARRQIGTSGIYLIDFDNTVIGSPAIFDISCNSKFNMELVQSGLGYGMASFFSGIADLPETPSLSYNATPHCVNTTATLTGDLGYAFYKWFVDGVEIQGAITNIHTATRTGTYEMGAFLPCGQLVKSLPMDVVLCADVSVVTTVDNSVPDMGSNIVFSVVASNIGNNSKAVSVTDLLPSGFTFVSAAVPPRTIYNSASGLWNIGEMEDGESFELKITATVNTTGIYVNSATITSSAQPDPTPGNNTSSIAVTPQSVNVGCQPVPTAVPVVQPTCSGAGTIEITNPLGTAYEYKLNNGAYQASELFTNVASGIYTVTVRLAADNTCVSLPATIVVNAVAGLPVQPTVIATQPTCSVSTGTIVITNPTEAVEYSIDGINYQVSNMFSNVPSGNYSVTARNSNDIICISTAVETMINPPPLNPSVPITTAMSNVGCNVFTANWNAASNTTNYFIDVSTDSSFSSFVSVYDNFYVGNVIAYPVSDLVTGTTYYYRVRSSNDVCTSVSSQVITAATSPVAPVAPLSSVPSGVTCSTINANWTASTNAFGYFLDVSTVNTFATFVNGYNSLDVGNVITYPVTGLVPGTVYYYRVRALNGCGTSGYSGNITVTTLTNPTAPIVSAITQPTCTALGIVELSGLPSSSWTLNLVGGTGVGVSGSGTTHTFSDVQQGNYNVLVTNAAGCSSVGSANISINAQPPTPSAPIVGNITQPTCSVATGSVVLSGLPLGDWVINPGAISGIGNSYMITGLSGGTYNFTVTNSSGCISAVSGNVGIDVQPTTPSAPIVGTITNPTCISAGEVELSGLPSGNWVLKRTGTSNSLTSGSGASITLGGLLPGIYTYTVVNDQGCQSAVSADVIIPEIPILPNQPTLGAVVHPSCSVSTGNITFNNLPSGLWILTQRGPINDDILGSGVSHTVTGLIAGDYSFELNSMVFCTTNNGNVTINAQPVTPPNPTVNIVQPSCTTTGRVELGGLPQGDWTLNLSGTTTSTIQGSGTTYNFTGLTVPGTYGLSVTNDLGCTSTIVGDIVLNAQPVTPAIPIVVEVNQPTCTALGIIELSGLPAGNWTLRAVGGTGSGISGSGATAVIENLPAETYNVTVTNDVGCTSNATNAIEIFTQPPTPSIPIVGAITNPSCVVSTGSVTLSGLPIGSWVINPGAVTGSGTSTTITGLTAGSSYNFTVTNDVGCISDATADMNIKTQPVTPTVPVVETITDPTCVTGTGSVVLNGLPLGNWIINPGVLPGTGAVTTITDLTAGSTYNFTVTNYSGCTSAPTADIVIEEKLIPDTPIILVVNNCGGTSTLSTSAIGNLLWSTNETTPAITVNEVGTYTVIATNSSGCVSLPGSGIASPKITPGTPAVTVDKNTITIVGVPNEIYSVDNGNYSDNLVYTNLEAGTHTIEAKNQFDCISPVTVIEIEEIPSKLLIHNAVSPNGDGKNDYFEIKGLEYFPDNSVEIFDRYGINVFKGNHYDNKNVVFRGEGLASGTYFYTIKYIDQDSKTHMLSGYLFLN